MTTQNTIFISPWLDRHEAANYLRLSYNTLETDVVAKNLKVPYHKFGKRVIYKLSELDAWAEAHRVEV